MAFQLALEAPDLVAAIAPVAPLPFQPSGPWLQSCHPQPGHERVSIAMLGATDDRFISYTPGGSPEYPSARYPGMEQTRDAWLAAMGIRGAPTIDKFPDVIRGDSLTPHRPGQQHDRATAVSVGARRSGALVLQSRRNGTLVAAPVQMWPDLWERFGKTNQDIDFADQAWKFFKRHATRR